MSIDNQKGSDERPVEETEEDGRKKVGAALGPLAAYTAPGMLAMLTSQAAMAASPTF